MTKMEAKIILNRQPDYAIRNMKTALEFHPWRNTPEETRRLVACYVYLNVPPAKRIKTS